MQSIPPLDEFLPPHEAIARGLMAIVTPEMRPGKWRTYGLRQEGHTIYIITFLNTVVCKTTLLGVAQFCYKLPGV